jgi:hypothetical protein
MRDSILPNSLNEFVSFNLVAGYQWNECQFLPHLVRVISSYPCQPPEGELKDGRQAAQP